MRTKALGIITASVGLLGALFVLIIASGILSVGNIVGMMVVAPYCALNILGEVFFLVGVIHGKRWAVLTAAILWSVDCVILVPWAVLSAFQMVLAWITLGMWRESNE